MRRQPQARSTKAKSRIDDFYDIKEKAQVRLQNDDMKIMVQASRLGSKILEAHSLVKSFGDKIILDGFTYKFKKGERIGIVGQNGTGKSTILKSLPELRPFWQPHRKSLTNLFRKHKQFQFCSELTMISFFSFLY